jgi:hypothetical protein
MKILVLMLGGGGKAHELYFFSHMYICDVSVIIPCYGPQSLATQRVMLPKFQAETPTTCPNFGHLCMETKALWCSLQNARDLAARLCYLLCIMAIFSSYI